MSKTGFEKWVKELDANITVCMAWFGEARTFVECCDYLTKTWGIDEIMRAFVRAR